MIRVSIVVLKYLYSVTETIHNLRLGILFYYIKLLLLNIFKITITPATVACITTSYIFLIIY
jgi:hypothetical protein